MLAYGASQKLIFAVSLCAGPPDEQKIIKSYCDMLL